MGLFLYLKVDNTQFYAIKTELKLRSNLNVPNKEIELFINGVPEKRTIKEAEQIIEPIYLVLVGCRKSTSYRVDPKYFIVGGLIWYRYNHGRDVMEDEH